MTEGGESGLHLHRDPDLPPPGHGAPFSSLHKEYEHRSGTESAPAPAGPESERRIWSLRGCYITPVRECVISQEKSEFHRHSAQEFDRVAFGLTLSTLHPDINGIFYLQILDFY